MQSSGTLYSIYYSWGIHSKIGTPRHPVIDDCPILPLAHINHRIPSMQNIILVLQGPLNLSSPLATFITRSSHLFFSDPSSVSLTLRTQCTCRELPNPERCRHIPFLPPRRSTLRPLPHRLLIVAYLPYAAAAFAPPLCLMGAEAAATPAVASCSPPPLILWSPPILPPTSPVGATSEPHIPRL